VILKSGFCIETLTKLSKASKMAEKLKISNRSAAHKIDGGKDGLIEFSTGDIPSIKKSKNGSLCVTAPQS